MGDLLKVSFIVLFPWMIAHCRRRATYQLPTSTSLISVRIQSDIRFRFSVSQYKSHAGAYTEIGDGNFECTLRTFKHQFALKL